MLYLQHIRGKPFGLGARDVVPWEGSGLAPPLPWDGEDIEGPGPPEVATLVAALVRRLRVMRLTNGNWLAAGQRVASVCVWGGGQGSDTPAPAPRPVSLAYRNATRSAAALPPLRRRLRPPRPRK